MNKRRFALALLGLTGLGAVGAEERLPAVNLIVELRWVNSAASPAALAAARDGAVVAGTAGSFSPRGAVVVGTEGSAGQNIEGEQRLLVLNGHRASVQLSRSEPLQWVDTTVEIAPGAAVGGPHRVYASPRQGEHLSRQSFAVTARWPGGGQPVRVEFSAVGRPGGAEAQTTELQSTLLLPLNAWQTVARSGAANPGAGRATVSSGDAAAGTQRELQIRVSPAP